MNNAIILIFLICIIGNQNTNGQAFSEVSESLGINTTAGAAAFGYGISFVDFNNDNYDDLTFGTDDGMPLLFFQNNSGLSFTQVYPTIYDAANHKQLLWADLDNDSDLDFILISHDGQNRIWRNDGFPFFTEMTTTCGIIIGNTEGTSAALCDIDTDGDLDMYFVNYCDNNCNNILYRNNGNFTFTNVTNNFGLGGNYGPGLATAFFDYDNDNDVDLYVSIDKLWENQLFKNNGTIPWQDVSMASNSNVVADAMNVGIGDFNNDHNLDIYITNLPDGNFLLKNNGDGTFSDIAAISGTLVNAASWAGNFADFNNDTYEDLYVSVSSSNENNENKFFKNNGDETFTEIILPNDTTASLSNVYGDINNDGFLDIVHSSKGNDKIYVYENQTANNRSYIKIKLHGNISNKNGIGSWIELYKGNQQQVRFTTCGQGYLSQNSNQIHFGVSNSNLIDSLIIRWPSGIEDKYYNISPNVTLNAFESCVDCGYCYYSDTNTYNQSVIPNGTYQNNTIISSGNVTNMSSVHFKAEEHIDLNPDFDALLGCSFIAEIVGCYEE